MRARLGLPAAPKAHIWPRTQISNANTHAYTVTAMLHSATMSFISHCEDCRCSLCSTSATFMNCDALIIAAAVRSRLSLSNT